MIQMSNVDDGKSEWNINESRIVIPMIDGDVTSRDSDKILTGALTINSFGVGDQTILANALEHSFIIGLDKNFFETSNYKNDLVIIQNPDLKLLPCTSEIKNPVACTLSFVDQERNEILWQSSVSKDKICVNSRGVLEVRDILNYDDSAQELEKSEPQINLDNVNSDVASQVRKTNDEILRSDVNEVKKEYVNYYPSIQNNNPVPVLSHLGTSRFIENIKTDENKKSEDIFLFKVDPTSDNYKSEKNSQKSNLNTIKPILKLNRKVPIDHNNQKINKIGHIALSTPRDARQENFDGKKDQHLRNVLPEKNLPLKKKAKMKRTLFSCESQRSLLKKDAFAIDQMNTKFSVKKKLKRMSEKTNSEGKEESPNDSDEPLINKVDKSKKSNKSNVNSKKSHVSIADSLEFENENENKGKNPCISSLNEETAKNDYFEFDRNKFNNIFDLIDCLRKCRMINGPVWQTLNGGLKEMTVDILEEMNSKIYRSSVEGTEYSPQLKAFALVLYFKQPAAFNHLSQVYKAGWPSLTVIKKWKQQMNSHQRSNFVKTNTNIV